MKKRPSLPRESTLPRKRSAPARALSAAVRPNKKLSAAQRHFDEIYTHSEYSFDGGRTWHPHHVKQALADSMPRPSAGKKTEGYGMNAAAVEIIRLVARLRGWGLPNLADAVERTCARADSDTTLKYRIEVKRDKWWDRVGYEYACWSAAADYRLKLVKENPEEVYRLVQVEISEVAP